MSLFKKIITCVLLVLVFSGPLPLCKWLRAFCRKSQKLWVSANKTISNYYKFFLSLIISALFQNSKQGSLLRSQKLMSWRSCGSFVLFDGKVRIWDWHEHEESFYCKFTQNIRKVNLFFMEDIKHTRDDFYSTIKVWIFEKQLICMLVHNVVMVDSKIVILPTVFILIPK